MMYYLEPNSHIGIKRSDAFSEISEKSDLHGHPQTFLLRSRNFYPMKISQCAVLTEGIDLKVGKVELSIRSVQQLQELHQHPVGENTCS